MKTIKSLRDIIAKVIRGILIGWAVILAGLAIIPCLLQLGFMAVLLLVSLLYNPKVDVTSPASQYLAESVLRDCNIGTGRLKKVRHGYKTMPSFHGDHFGAYAIEISDVDVSALTPERGWTRGDQMSGETENSVWGAIQWFKGKVKWFPGGHELKSADMFVYSPPQKKEWDFSVVLLRLSDKMVFYLYVQT